jgi:hypothetical protein
MKAKDYAQKWINEGKSRESLFAIMQGFFSEITDLVKKRNAIRSDAIISIYKEIDTKFRAFARVFPNEINPEGLRLLMLIRVPSSRQIHHLIWPHKKLPPRHDSSPLQIEIDGPNGQKMIHVTTAGEVRVMVRDSVYAGVRASQKIEDESVGPYNPPPLSSVPDHLLTT